MAGIAINQTIVLIKKVGLGGKDFGLKSATALMRDRQTVKKPQKALLAQQNSVF
jgi:hypothetical protein